MDYFIELMKTDGLIFDDESIIDDILKETLGTLYDSEDGYWENIDDTIRFIRIGEREPDGAALKFASGNAGCTPYRFIYVSDHKDLIDGLALKFKEVGFIVEVYEEDELI